MIKAHKGPPPIGWENVPGMAGFIREKKATKKDDNDLMGIMRTLAEREMAKSLGEMEKVQGPKGDDGKPGADGRDGKDGKDGKNGLPGKDGKDGRDGAPGPAGKDGKPGPAGKDGKPGKDGKDGKDGQPGADGVGIKSVKSFGSDVQIELTDGRKTKFRIAGGGGGTPFGGGGGGGGGTITVGAGDPTGAGTDGQLYIDASVTPPILWAYTNDAWSVVGGAGCEPTIRQDASYPIAYAGKATKIMKLDYSVAGVVTRSKATTTDLDTDWPNRASLTYTPC